MATGMELYKIYIYNYVTEKNKNLRPWLIYSFVEIHIIAPITLKLNNLQSIFLLQTVLLYVLLTDLQNLYPIINMC